MQIRFKENNSGILSKQQVAATGITRHIAAGNTDSISSSSRCHRAAILQLMTKGRRFAMVIIAVLAFGIPLHASSDYDSGKRAWEDGQLGEALEYWTVAAETGDRRSMLELGRLFLLGLGVPQDYGLAHKWFNLAAARGEMEALSEREAVAEKMASWQFAEAQKWAHEWRPDRDSPLPEAAAQIGTAELTLIMEEPPPEAQAQLAALGYKPGAVDGVWGSRTGRIRANFLRDAGLSESEILIPQTLRAIRAVTAQQGVQTSEVSAPASSRQTAANLHEAVLAGDIDGLKSALAAGTNVNVRDSSGRTPLMQAANKGYVVMVALLLDTTDVDINAQAVDGATALFIAAVHGHTKVIELLMKAGANVNIPGPKGKSAVELAKTHYGEPTSETIRKHEPAIQALLRGMSYAGLQKEREEREKLMRMYPAGKEIQDCDSCPKMVVIPPGTFTMGSPVSEEKRDTDEGPQHQVTFSHPFAVGKYEVTFREWDACVSSSGCLHRPDDEGWGRRNRPVINVSWHDAQAYVSWLSRKTGEQYRLLTESEWEYVARAGTTGPFHFGSTISTNQANYDGDSTYGRGSYGVFRGNTVWVGTFPANSFGLHEVHGNVWEWVEECYHENYHDAPSDGSAWVTGGNCEGRMLRGGSWDDLPWDLRSAVRGWVGSGLRSFYIGFRVARTLTP